MIIKTNTRVYPILQCNIAIFKEGIAMTSATLHTSNYAPEQPASVADALHGLAIATQRLVLALWAAVGQRASAAPQVLTRREEADELRAFANTHMATDPGFADDLYAAADRHESGDHA